MYAWMTFGNHAQSLPRKKRMLDPLLVFRFQPVRQIEYLIDLVLIQIAHFE